MALRTKTNIGPVQEIYRIRTITANTEALKPYLQWIFNRQKTRFLINVSYGYILRHTETNEYSFYWPSAENNRVLEYPHRISSAEDMAKFVNSINQKDILKWAQNQRPNTKFVVEDVSCASFYLEKQETF